MISGRANTAKATPTRKKKVVAPTSGSTSFFSWSWRPGLMNHQICQKMIGAAPTRPTTKAIFRPSMKAPVGAKKKSPVFCRPERTIRSSRIRCQKKKAMAVAPIQPAREMMRARRRSSRFARIDMRPSSSRGLEGFRRPLMSRAIGGRLALLLGLGLPGLRRRGGRRVLLPLVVVDRGRHLFGDLVGRLPELLDAATDGTAELGQLPG